MPHWQRKIAKICCRIVRDLVKNQRHKRDDLFHLRNELIMLQKISPVKMEETEVFHQQSFPSSNLLPKQKCTNKSLHTRMLSVGMWVLSYGFTLIPPQRKSGSLLQPIIVWDRISFQQQRTQWSKRVQLRRRRGISNTISWNRLSCIQ